MLGNLDEAYDFLTSFGLTSEDGKQDARKQAKLNPHQSALNKLLQFGTAARATKTNGSYGEGASQTISLGVTCNMHPTQYIPMERGELGSHHVATKERFLGAPSNHTKICPESTLCQSELSLHSDRLRCVLKKHVVEGNDDRV